MEKDSVEYFMTKMSQQEFQEIMQGKEVVSFNFNHIQPDSSKREDIEDLGHDFVTVGCTDHQYCIKCGEEDHVIKSKMMRCSELYGNIET